MSDNTMQGLLSDCFLPEQRGKAISIYSLGPLLGPAIGPMLGGFVSQNTTCEEEPDNYNHLMHLTVF